MLFGEYFHQIDEKNRLRLPSKLKAELTECTIIKGKEKCLYLLPAQTLAKINEKIDGLPMFGKVQAPLRILFSSGAKVEEDNQGRFLLPSVLKDYAEIKKDVVFIGVGNRAELWSAENWKKYNDENSKHFEQILEELGEYGI